MKTPRIVVDEEVWAKVRDTAFRQNTTTSKVVTNALDQYLGQRNLATSHGSATPTFTGTIGPNLTDATDKPVTNTGGEARIAHTETTPFVQFRPAPKPAKRGR